MRHLTIRRVTAIALAALPAAPATAAHAACPLPVFGPGASYDPTIVPRHFTSRVTNAWFPLRPGRVLVSSGVKDGKRALDIFAPSSRTRRIDGVRTRIVQDRLYLDGVLAERTQDYYAQDRCGNVWYFGEDTAELDARGRVTSREGSFHAGVNGAQPGVVMQARPQRGRWFRQEWSPGQAEDAYRALAFGVHVVVPAGSFRHALRTEERTALEPGVLDEKLYVRGTGTVLEQAVRGPQETLRLVEVID